MLRYLVCEPRPITAAFDVVLKVLVTLDLVTKNAAKTRVWRCFRAEIQMCAEYCPSS